MASKEKTGGDSKGAGEKRGAGAPSKAKLSTNPALVTPDPATFLRALMMDQTVDVRLRQDSAKKLLGLEEEERAKKGKKEKQADEASTVATQGSKFAPLQPPKLVAVK